MEFEIRVFEGETVAGVCRRTSFAHDLTSEIWREFRSREHEIPDRVGSETYSIKVYGPDHSFSRFDPAAEFEKWAAAPVGWAAGSFDGMRIPPGEYAVFIHRGPASDAARTFGYIFGEWLPASEFEIDLRPHFEILPAGYDPFDPAAEEEIWVPVKRK